MTKLRIISDLHYDVGLNKTDYFNNEIGKAFLAKPVEKQKSKGNKYEKNCNIYI